jgi:hypothetical protein
MPDRFKILGLAAAILFCVLLLRVFFGGGGVTVDFREAPLARVLKELSKQTGTSIETNLPLETPVTLQLKNAPPAEAIDILAARLDVDWQLAYLFAPNRKATDSLLTSFRARERLEEAWPSFGGMGPGMMFVSENVTDPRRDEWRVESAPEGKLASYLLQGSAKTRAFFAMAPGWDPTVKKAPKSGSVGSVAGSLAKQAGGTVREVILLQDGWGRGGGGDRGRTATRENNTGAARERTQTGSGDRWAGGRGGTRSGVFASQRGQQGGFNPAWIEERMETAIRELPVEEREEARRDIEEMRQMWAEVRTLPEEQRREKIQEIFSNPRVQERMEERRASRDAKRTPEQRLERYRNYVDRKMEARKNEGRPLGNQ